MSGEDEFNLTGEWTGIYNYPALYPPNAFEASIRDTGGVITGVTRQRREIVEAPGGLQHAVIEGTRTGSTVRWVKMYDDLTRATLFGPDPARRGRDRGRVAHSRQLVRDVPDGAQPQGESSGNAQS